MGKQITLLPCVNANVLEYHVKVIHKRKASECEKEIMLPYRLESIDGVSLSIFQQATSRSMTACRGG